MTTRTSLGIGVLILSVGIALLHKAAITHYFYWIYWWFDILMHFLGGLLIGLGALWLWYFSRWCGVHTIKKGKLFWIGIGSAIIVGVGWEVFELWAGIAITEDLYADTALDLVMDTLGGGVGALLVMALPNKTHYDG